MLNTVEGIHEQSSLTLKSSVREIRSSQNKTSAPVEKGTVDNLLGICCHLKLKGSEVNKQHVTLDLFSLFLALYHACSSKDSAIELPFAAWVGESVLSIAPGLLDLSTETFNDIILKLVTLYGDTCEASDGTKCRAKSQQKLQKINEALRHMLHLCLKAPDTHKMLTKTLSKASFGRVIARLNDQAIVFHDDQLATVLQEIWLQVDAPVHSNSMKNEDMRVL